MTARVLVTGSGGFTARYLVPELEKIGCEVFCTGTFNGDQEHYLMADLRNPHVVNELVAWAKPSAVVHLAGISFVGHSNPLDFYSVNTIGTRNLLSALEKRGASIDTVILASTAAVYGSKASGVVSEETPPRPSSEYAASKLAMEQLSNFWFDRLPITITRPFNYTGRGQSSSFIIPKIVEHVKNKKKIIELGNIDITRDFSDVRDVARSYALLVQKPLPGETLNICSGIGTSLRKIFDYATSVGGHSPRMVVNESLVREKDPKILQGDRMKFIQMVGQFELKKVEETIRWMIDED